MRRAFPCVAFMLLLWAVVTACKPVTPMSVSLPSLAATMALTDTPTTAPTPTEKPTLASMPTPEPTATPSPMPPPADVGWLDPAGEPGRTRFNPAARPGRALPLWRLRFHKWGESEVYPVEVAALPNAIFMVDSTGRLLRVDMKSGQVTAQATIWPYGSRGSVPGAVIALTGDVIAVSAGDLYVPPQSRLPYFRSKLILFDADNLTRLWELPGQFGRDYQITAQRGQIAVTTDGSTIAMYQAKTGQVVWHQADAGQQYRILAATHETLFVRGVSMTPPEQRGPYEQRQTFLALDWATGQVRWRVRPKLADDATEALTDGERLYLLTYQGYLLALNVADGSEAWQITEGPTLYDRSPIALAYGKVYGFRSPDQAIVAYDAASGQEVWRTPLTEAWSVPTLAIAGGYIYLIEQQGDGSNLKVLEANMGQIVAQEEIAREPSATVTIYWRLAIAADRLILAGHDLRTFGEQPQTADPLPAPPPAFPTPVLPADEILYESTEMGNGDIWARPADGAAPPRNLTAHGAHDWDPAGSPDGRRVAFESYRSGSSNLWVVNRDGSDPVAITQIDQKDSYNVHPTWSPNGEFIAFASDRNKKLQIWLTRADGSEPHQLTSEGKNWDPAWSPDGSLIAFISDRSGNPDIWVMAADGSNQRPWRESPEPEANPAWSPGCASDLNGPTCALAFVRITGEQPDWGELRAGLFNGSLEWSIPGTFWGYDRGPAWWPGCQALGSDCVLVWGRRTEDKPQLVLGDLDGSQVQIIGEGKDPSWLIMPGR